jgi:uncharacterized protein with PQ loop repeat
MDQQKNAPPLQVCDSRMDMQEAPFLWVLSLVATILVWLGYVPEFLRLYREKQASNIGISMWLIWTSSSGLSTVYAFLSGATTMVVINVGAIFVLTVLAAFGNLCMVLRNRRGVRPSSPVQIEPRRSVL